MKEDRQRFNLNLEVQLLLKQGQVEVDSGAFIHDYKDSALLHRSVVEELNNNIKVITVKIQGQDRVFHDPVFQFFTYSSINQLDMSEMTLT